MPIADRLLNVASTGVLELDTAPERCSFGGQMNESDNTAGRSRSSLTI
jgi:hypothetical protein